MKHFLFVFMLCLVLVGCPRPPETANVSTPEPHLRVAVQKNPLVIKEIDMEHYLMGVLVGEMYADWPLATLMAQAVASRTYALYRMEHPTDAEFDVTANVDDQVFDRTQPPHSSVVEAVKQTRGEVLLFNGEVIPAFFHSCSGGYLEKPSRVWRWAKPYDFLGAKADPHAEDCKDWSWEYTVSRRELSKTLRRWGYQLPEGWFIQLSTYPGSPRVRDVSFVSPLLPVSPVRLSGARFRRLMGFSDVKSTLFSVDEEKKSVTFKGRGFGHGVGMSQWGARGLALTGASYEDILKYYYPQTILTKVY